MRVRKQPKYHFRIDFQMNVHIAEDQFAVATFV